LHIQEITITGPITQAGSHMIKWNVDVGGGAFGQIWTFADVSGYTQFFHVKTRFGFYANFPTYAAAERAIRGQA
jgi:hypothetical protein